MRPNIDIPHALHGRVKDWAEEHDVAVEQVYQHCIEQGLDAIETPAEIQQ